MNRATKMVLLWFGEDMRQNGVADVKCRIDEALDAFADETPSWIVDVCGINLLVDSEVQWDILRDLINDCK